MFSRVSTHVLKFYLAARKSSFLSMSVIWTRYLIGFAFIPSGLKKVVGMRFTSMPVSNPVGFFFEALYQSGIYWNFLGWTQVIAAFLLMTQRFATLGNAIFFPLVFNVFLITYSMQFKGTVYITALMLVASFCLLLWDLPKLIPLIAKDNSEYRYKYHDLPSFNNIGIITGVIFFFESVMLSLSMMYPGYRQLIWILMGAILLTAIFSFILMVKKKAPIDQPIP
jgi:hypothetical protein